jgi:hypothetical protein
MISIDLSLTYVLRFSHYDFGQLSSVKNGPASGGEKKRRKTILTPVLEQSRCPAVHRSSSRYHDSPLKTKVEEQLWLLFLIDVLDHLSTQNTCTSCLKVYAEGKELSLPLLTIFFSSCCHIFDPFCFLLFPCFPGIFFVALVFEPVNDCEGSRGALLCLDRSKTGVLFFC